MRRDTGTPRPAKKIKLALIAITSVAKYHGRRAGEFP
jgi:hypothetical protein